MAKLTDRIGDWFDTKLFKFVAWRFRKRIRSTGLALAASRVKNGRSSTLIFVTDDCHAHRIDLGETIAHTCYCMMEDAAVLEAQLTPDEASNGVFMPSGGKDFVN